MLNIGLKKLFCAKFALYYLNITSFQSKNTLSLDNMDSQNLTA